MTSNKNQANYAALPIDKFKDVVENTPLISIDFIIKDNTDNYLLGKRVNKPAVGYWFTLGGRVLKNETINHAIKRLSKKEFNQEITIDSLKFHGVYEHFYSDSFVDENISTHYIILAYELERQQKLDLPKNEHSEYKYFSYEEIMQDSTVHKYVKDYLKKEQ